MSFPVSLDWYLDKYEPPPKQRRKTRSRMAEPRERWRITLGELCYAAKITPVVFQLWADSGYLGSRLRSLPSQGGRGRHITRETAQRTVLLARLVTAGLTPEAASHVATAHAVGDDEPLRMALPGGVLVTIQRDDLP